MPKKINMNAAVCPPWVHSRVAEGTLRVTGRRGEADWAQSGPIVGPIWAQNGPRMPMGNGPATRAMSQFGPIVGPKWPQSGPNVGPDWARCRREKACERASFGFKWAQSGPKVVPLWAHFGTRAAVAALGQ